MSKRKMEPATKKRKWDRQIKFYHNKGSMHFYLGVARKGDYIAGHDMTTHPSLTFNGTVRKKYLKLYKNPNPNDNRDSYIDKKLRSNVNVYFDDSRRKRLKVKKKWKLSKKDKKRINHLDKNKIKNPHNSI